MIEHASFRVPKHIVEYGSSISLIWRLTIHQVHGLIPVSLKDAMKADNVEDPMAIGMCYSPRTSDDNRPLQKKGLLPGQQRRQSEKFTG